MKKKTWWGYILPLPLMKITMKTPMLMNIYTYYLDVASGAHSSSITYVRSCLCYMFLCLFELLFSLVSCFLSLLWSIVVLLPPLITPWLCLVSLVYCPVCFPVFFVEYPLLWMLLSSVLLLWFLVPVSAPGFPWFCSLFWFIVCLIKVAFYPILYSHISEFTHCYRRLNQRTDPTSRSICLRQSNHSLEDHTRDFLDISSHWFPGLCTHWFWTKTSPITTWWSSRDTRGTQSGSNEGSQKNYKRLQKNRKLDYQSSDRKHVTHQEVTMKSVTPAYSKIGFIQILTLVVFALNHLSAYMTDCLYLAQVLSEHESHKSG